MPTAKFALEVPPNTWMAEVSTSFPDTRFRLLTGIQNGDEAVELGETVGGETRRADAALAAHPDILDHERLYAGDERVLGRYRTTELAMYEFLQAASVPPQFPVVVQRGWTEFEVTAPRERLREIDTMLDDSGLTHEVRGVADRTDPESLLTDRQRSLLRTAVREGYYAVPRECTLTELAQQAGVDKSTASGVVRRGEGRLVEWALTSPGSDR